MFPFEVLVLVYSGGLAVAALLRPRGRHRGRAFLGAITMAATAVSAGADGLPVWARLWLMPLLYIGAGYWIPAMLVPADRVLGERTRFEGWLTRSDARLSPHLPALPPGLRFVAELAYLACYPLVPMCLSLVWLRGGVSEVVEYWTAVLAAGFACYASLPWLVSRPPALLAADDADAVTGRALDGSPRVSRLNRWVLSRVSHRWTTFPSGHVAVSCAAAVGLARVWPAAGSLAALVAAGVAVGAVAGRYHFLVDVLAGLAVAIAIVMVT